MLGLAFPSGLGSNTASPGSPTPSPAGSISSGYSSAGNGNGCGTFGNGASTPMQNSGSGSSSGSGTCSSNAVPQAAGLLSVPAPFNVHMAQWHLHSLFKHVSMAHELWHQADDLVERENLTGETSWLSQTSVE